MSDGKNGGEAAAKSEQPGPADSVNGVGEVIAGWRARAVRVLLAVVAVIGLPAWGTVIANGIRSGEMRGLLWVYLIVYLAIAALAVLPGIDQRVRIWGLVILGYANGLASLARLGLDGSGRLYLLLVPIFTTVLVGTRAGLATAVASLVTYAFFAARVGAAASAAWVEAGTALAAFVFSAVVLLGRFSQFQLQILRREREARTQLEAAREALQAYSASLEEKVLERTARLAEAKQEAEAANRRFEQELAFAGRIQAGFMAAQLPQIPAYESAAALIPARATSGDFYDVFSLPGDRYGILIADVVDKGVGAALFMALCWALLHTAARQYPDEPAQVLAATNRRILRDTHAEQFVTVFYGVLEPASGRMLYANAGHPPPYHLRDGELSSLLRTGIPLGIRDGERWVQESVVVQPADLCVFYTDGVTEAQNGDGGFFEAGRLVAILEQCGGCPAAEVRAAILDALAHFAGETVQADDITLLVLAHTGAGGAPSPGMAD